MQIRLTNLDAVVWLMVYVFLPLFLFMAFFPETKQELELQYAIVFIAGPIIILIATLRVWVMLTRRMGTIEQLLLAPEKIAEGGVFCLSSPVVGLVAVGALWEDFRIASFITLLVCIFLFKEGLRFYYTARPFLEIHTLEFEHETLKEMYERTKEEEKKK